MCTTCNFESQSTWQRVDVPSHPLKDAQWVSVIAEIRLNKTGEVRQYQKKEILSKGEAQPSAFNWVKHNNSCDCNRELFFGYAAGLSYAEMRADDRECSHGQYSVRLLNSVDNKPYY